jgi:hypothetical protein
MFYLGLTVMISIASVCAENLSSEPHPCLWNSSKQLTMIQIDQNLWRNVCRTPEYDAKQHSQLYDFHEGTSRTHGFATGNNSSGMTFFAPALTDWVKDG